jgi:hypothetical protein
MAEPGEIGFRPKSFSRQTNDIAGDSPISARFIGSLTPDKTRLNVFSSLTKNDRVDYFQFRISDVGKVGIGVDGDTPIRIEVMDRRSGRIFADSTATVGEKKDAWEALADSKSELAKGDYVLRITRDVGVNPSDNASYAIQLTSGDSSKIREDYDTIERPQRRSDNPRTTPSANLAVNLVAGGNKDSGGFLNIFV